MDRWDDFLRHREFIPFTREKKDRLLEEEFALIHKTRLHLWTTVGYERVNIVPRAAGCAPFAYTRSTSIAPKRTELKSI